jgi:hypothetical protein
MTFKNLPGKALITKGLFAVSIVAITATVGVVSFAQAAKPFNNGYGGVGEAIRAAVQEFQNSVHAATQTLKDDIDACLADAGYATASGNFKAEADASSNEFSSQFATTSAIDRDDAKMDSKLEAASANQEKKLDQVETNLLAVTGNLDASRHHNSELRQCLREARQDFRDSIQEAKKKLRAAIRDILGRR